MSEFKKFRNLDDFYDNAKRGDWFIFDTKQETFAAIRYGDKSLTGSVVIPISTHPEPGKCVWQWNGDRINPTLSPSILVEPVPNWNEGWHGWLRDGVLISV